MKRIHFSNFNKKGGFILLPLLLIGIIFILNGAFNFFEFENSKLNKYLTAIGFVIIFGFQTQMFWYTNYVQWNNRRIIIRVKSFLGKNVNFKDLLSSELANKKLILRTVQGTKIEFDVSNIIPSDAEKLNEIIIENIRKSNQIIN